MRLNRANIRSNTSSRNPIPDPDRLCQLSLCDDADPDAGTDDDHVFLPICEQPTDRIVCEEDLFSHVSPFVRFTAAGWHCRVSHPPAAACRILSTSFPHRILLQGLLASFANAYLTFLADAQFPSFFIANFLSG